MATSILLKIIHSKPVQERVSLLSQINWHATQSLYYSGVLRKIDRVKYPIKWNYFQQKYKFHLDRLCDAGQSL